MLNPDDDERLLNLRRFLADWLSSSPVSRAEAVDVVIKAWARAPAGQVTSRVSDQRVFQVSFCVAKDDNTTQQINKCLK